MILALADIDEGAALIALGTAPWAAATPGTATATAAITDNRNIGTSLPEYML
jgi:hypothetical protein